jgi:hypothetical protein
MYPYALKRSRSHHGSALLAASRSTAILLCEAVLYQKIGVLSLGKAQGNRPRSNRMDVWADNEELTEINRRAEALRLSRSEYLRNLGLGYQPKSQFDQEAVRSLVKLNADQGRLGGLLKLWLSEKPGEGASQKNVKDVLNQIESLQQLMAQLVLKGITKG